MTEASPEPAEENEGRVEFGAHYVALPTPFDESGQIDQAALNHIIDYLLSREIDGIALLTEAAEDPLLTVEERNKLVEHVATRVKGKKALLVSISYPATRPAVDLARLAAGKGVQGVLLAPLKVPGLGYRELYRLVDKLARGASLSIHLTVRPHNAVSGLAPEELGTLAKHEAIKGVFLPEGHESQFSTWARRLKSKPGAHIWCGCALDFPSAARAGASAAICGLTMLAVDQSIKLIAAVRNGDLDQIRSIEKRVRPAIETLGPPRSTEHLEGVKKLATKLAKRALSGSGLLPSVPFAMIKAGLKLQGHPVKGIVRPPYEPLSAEQQERLRAVMKSSGLL